MAPVTNIEKLVAQGRFDRQLALVREHLHSVRQLFIDTLEPLKVARLGPDLAPDLLFGTGIPGLDEIKPTRSDRFEFAKGGHRALILPCFDTIPGLLDATPERYVEDLRDLVAVDLDHPDRFCRRRGEALVLGNAFLEIAGQECAPVPVFRNPLTWLQSGGAGVCILDWDYARDLLLDRDLIAEDVKLGTRLEGALKPHIWVEVAA